MNVLCVRVAVVLLATYCDNLCFGESWLDLLSEDFRQLPAPIIASPVFRVSVTVCHVGSRLGISREGDTIPSGHLSFSLVFNVEVRTLSFVLI